MPANAEQRRSAGGVPYLPLGIGVTPNATHDAEWRAQAGWAYSGISYSPPVVPPTHLNTAEGRRAAAGIPYLPLGVNVTPNAAHDSQWRSQSGWSYSGLTYVTPSTGDVTPETFNWVYRKQRLRARKRRFL